MEKLFISLLNTSINAGYLVIAVMVLRPILKKAPKYIRCILWGLVGLRLVLPVSLESVLSLIPSAETVPPEILTSPTPTIHSGVSFLNSTVNPVLTQSMAPVPEASVNPMQVVMGIAWNVWLMGMLVMAVYSVVSFLILKYKLRESVQDTGNVWLCDRIPSPFLLGWFRPRIYLPSELSDGDKTYVLAHENAHILRKDHWWKPLGFLLLTIYWFNPLMWVAYIFLCRDIEFACDEKVIRKLGSQAKQPYSEALINCSVSRKMISACPVAFGEDGVKGRIKSVLNYKKPAFWIILIAMIVCIVVAVCFLTNPPKDGQSTSIPANEYRFRAKVVEIREDSLLVEPLEKPEYFSGAKQVVIQLNGRSQQDYRLGCIVEVIYDSQIQETMPPIIPNASSIFNLDLVSSHLPDPYYSFTATVTEVLSDCIIVKYQHFPLHNFEFSFYQVNIDPTGFVVGNKVAIAYDGIVTDGNPYSILGTIYSIDTVASGNITSPFEAQQLSPNRCTISAGTYHTVGIKNDGTVAAWGSDSGGCCDVDSWTNIISVSAGPIYTVGLKSDGTVIWTGTTAPSFIEASNWKNIVAIDAGAGHMVGLKSDRTVNAVGDNEYNQCSVEGWADMVAVSAGLYHTVGIRSNGTVVATGWNRFGQCDVQDWQNIIAISAGDYHTVGLKSDGTVVATGWEETGRCDVDQWTNITAISAGYAHTVGLKSDGTVVAVGNDDDGQCRYVKKWNNIVAIGAGWRHTVGITSNGSAVSVGRETIEQNNLEPSNSYHDQLKETYPLFFNLSTFKGLEVYVWKNGDWRCGVRSGTNRNATHEELMAFGGGATLEEMAVILSTYGITQDKVAILYSYDPAFSGPYPNEPSQEDQAMIEQTLYAYLPAHIQSEPYIAPTYDVRKNYKLVVYGFQVGESNWRYLIYKNNSIGNTIGDACYGFNSLSAEDAKKTLAEYDLSPEEIPVIPITSYISSYLYEITERTAQEARSALGLP